MDTSKILLAALIVLAGLLVSATRPARAGDAGSWTGATVHAALLASETHAELLSGNQLYMICRNGLVGDDFCVGYIVGASEAWWKAKATLATTLGAGFGLAWCREEATNGQVTDVVVAFLRDHPELRHQPALDLVIEALSDAFPC